MKLKEIRSAIGARFSLAKQEYAQQTAALLVLERLTVWTAGGESRSASPEGARRGRGTLPGRKLANVQLLDAAVKSALEAMPHASTFVIADILNAIGAKPRMSKNVRTRLKKLVGAGLLTQRPGERPTHPMKYRFTEKFLSLPVQEPAAAQEEMAHAAHQ